MAIDFDDALDTDHAHLAPSMNTTPLIDVLLVLLVMLIITIPIQLHAVSMELPAGLPPPEATEPLVVRLSVDAANQMSWNGEAVPDRAALEARLREAAALTPQPEIHVRAEPQAKYDIVAGVLTAAQRLGLQKIGLVGLEDYAAGAPSAIPAVASPTKP